MDKQKILDRNQVAKIEISTFTVNLTVCMVAKGIDVATYLSNKWQGHLSNFRTACPCQFN